MKVVINTLSVIAFIVIFTLVFQNDKLSVDGNQVGKREFFALVSLVVSMCGVVSIWANKMRFTLIDGLVLLLGGYVAVNYFMCDSLAFSRMVVFVMLIVLYFNLRLILSVNKNMIFVLIGVFLLSGTVEACIGIKQLLFAGASNHSLYKITGSFFNPGPLGGYMALVASVSLAVMVLEYKNILIKHNYLNICSAIYLISIIAFITSFLVLPASMSRTAWGAFIVSCLVVLMTCKAIRAYMFKYRFYVLAAFVIVILGCLGAYKLKPESAEGRLVMWEIGLKAICEHPVSGIGFGHFAESFSQAQFDYFKENKGAEMIAGSPEYGFNEYIQIAVELGVIGLLFFVSILFFALVRLFKGDSYMCSFGVGLITMLIFAFASYPFSLLPFLIVLVAIVASASSSEKGFLINKYFKLIISGIAVAASIYGYNKIDSYPYREWRLVQMLYNDKFYKDIVDDYNDLYPLLKDNHKFIYEYGHVLGFTGHHNEAIDILKRGVRLSCDPMFYNVIGNNYKQLGDIENAEKYYWLAYGILPSRIYPLYLLVKLHNESGNILEAKRIAAILLNRPDKVKSRATEDMREEVSKILIFLNRL